MSIPGVMTITSRDSAGSALNAVKLAGDIPSKMQRLRKLKEQLFHADAVILSAILPQLLELLLDRFGPVRKFVTEIIGEIGYKDIEFFPDIAPALLDILKDDTPAVARQAVACGAKLFRYALIKFTLQGLSNNEVDGSFELWWHWMLKFKETMYSAAFQPGNEGVRLLALKFVESVILLYTPDPDGAPEPPVHMPDGSINEFNISWLRGGHPILNVRELSAEASKTLGLLLDQLRNAEIKSLSDYAIIVLINSLSEIASKRPAFYGRILPVLLGLDPKTSVIKGIRVSATHHALKQAFCSCLKCTHPGAVPWRDRLVCALEEMNAGGLAVEIMHHVCQPNEKIERRDDTAFLEERRPPVKPLQCDEPNFDRKRTVEQHINELIDDSVKRIKVSPNISDPLPDELSGDLEVAEDEFSSHQQAPLESGGDNGPVQQLVAMFGALVAQGEKAADSLEILISSISSDLLTEVIIANMCHLPSFCPCSEDDDPLKESFHGTDAGVKHLPSFVADILSLPDFFPQIISPSEDRQLFHGGLMTHQRLEEIETLSDNNEAHDCMHARPEESSVPLSLQDSPALSLPEMEGHSVVPSDILDLGGPAGEIPGLSSAVEILDYPEAADMPTFVSYSNALDPEVEVTMQGGVEGDIILVSPPERSEEHSLKASLTDTSSIVSSAETSFGLSTQVILPKMSAPSIDLNDMEKDHLQKLALIRILEAYKQSEAAGGLHIRFGLLASLGIEFPLEFDHWKLLLEHILADYVTNKGHELTLCILFRLFGESEEERDFFSSTTASSTYEMFLLAVAESLRDSFPASDKSLGRLFGEVPHMPKSLLKLVESLCSPETSSSNDKGLQSGDRVIQGLSAVWSLILSRPPFRLVCLKIALQSTVHPLEEVRMKAIRLVANKLYQLPSVSQQIEDFAKEMLMSVAIDESIMDVEKSVEDGTSLSSISNEVGSKIEAHSSSSPQALSFSVSESQRCMSLYFALCTKKHSLFREIFSIYKKTSMGVKQAVDRQIPMLVRTMGSSPELLEIISDPPIGSENLLFQIVHTLTDGIVPSPAFLSTVRNLYESKLQDAEILIPILQFLSKEEVLKMFHHIVSLPSERFQAALLSIVQGSHTGAVLTPAEVLIAIHGIDPSKDGIPLKKITEACNICFEQTQIFTQQVLAQVLNQLVEQIPLPLLFMRTVLQAVGTFPALVEFIMEILSRLVNKQIWKNSKLWVGFLKCAALTKPQSFNILLQLPPAQLENALARNTALKAPLATYASQQNIRTSIPRSLLAVLGLLSDSQPSEPSQAVESQQQLEPGKSEKAGGTDRTPESSSAS